MSNFLIREINSNEIYILKDMLYEAIFQPDETNLLPKSIIQNPEISVYIDNWGQSDDLCFVAEVNGKIVGAVWTRILAGKIKGYGNIDSKTPEFAISLYKEYRNQGIGAALMKQAIKELEARGYKQASLSVQKDNYAKRLYENVGFKIIGENEHDYIMLVNLT